MLNPERIARLKEIFLTASALPEEERAPYLEDACSGDAGLREEVDSLLARSGDTAEVRRAAALPAFAPPSAGRIPERIAAYRVLGLLGEGGMGVVYRAEQEHPVRREVAVKVSRPGFESAGVLARFESERQVLAMMDHPHIARLLDAGSTDEDRAYFVMELVRGVPLTDYCRQAGLSLRRRVELFLKIVQGVKHAHQHGIVHRDLKPSNVLVALSGDEPVPKIIDFSVAKALGDPLLAVGDRTRTGQLVGTLDYMAPEQALGRVHEIDARTDVYALGVLLHVLLSDRLPIDLAGLPLHEAIQKIATEPPASLRSARTRERTTSTGSSRIDPDLATIAGKCLEKERDRRYPSATELAEDLERYLGSRPILARPTSTAYQFRKLVRRHPVAFGSIGAAFVVLTVFAVTVTYQLGVQRAERARAELHARREERISAFVQTLLESADPAKAGGRVSIREVLDRAAQSVGKGLEEEPEVVAEIHRVIGTSYWTVGALDAAIRHAQAGLAVRRALIRRGAEPDLPSARLFANLAEVLIARSEFSRGLRAARLAAWMGFTLEGPDSLVGAEALRHSALALNYLGRLAEARPDAERSVEIRRRALPPGHPDLADSLLILGMVQGGEDGEKTFREALAIQKAALGEDSHPYLHTLNLLEVNLGDRGEATYDERLAIRRRLLAGAERIHGNQANEYAMMANNLGYVLIDRPEGLAEGEQYFRIAHEIWRKVGEGREYTLIALGNVAFTKALRGDFEGSAAGYREALSVAEGSEVSRTLSAAKWSVNLGVAEHLAGDAARAEADIRRGLAMATELLPEGLLAGVAEGWLGCLLAEAGRPVDAERHLRRAIEYVVRATSVGSDLHLFLVNALGRALAAQGRRSEAEAEIERSRPFLLERMQSPRELRHALEETAKVFDAWGRPADAEACRAARKRLDDAVRSGPGGEGAGMSVKQAWAQADTVPEKPVEHVYSVAGGVELKAYVFSGGARSTGERSPAIVLFHGGGWAVGEPQWAFARAIHFARRGMVAVAVQYRLSDQKEITPFEAMADARAAIRWMRAHADSLGIDPQRIAAYGWSAGAHLAASAAIFDDRAPDEKFSAIPNALVLVSPAVSLESDGWVQRLLGRRGTARDISPDEHVRKGLPPTLILQGSADTVTPLEGVNRFCERLEAAGNACELHVYQGFGHLFTPAGIPDDGTPQPDPATSADALARADRFLESLQFIE